MRFKDYLRMDSDELKNYAAELCEESRRKRLNGEVEESNILKDIEKRVIDRISLL